MKRGVLYVISMLFAVSMAVVGLALRPSNVMAKGDSDGISASL